MILRRDKEKEEREREGEREGKEGVDLLSLLCVFLLLLESHTTDPGI